MHTIPSAAIPVVAAEARAALHGTDRALLANAQMLAAVIEGADASDVPLNITQDIYARIVAHGGKLVEGREDLRQLISRMTVLHGQSDQRELATGCPAGAPKIFTGASLPSEQQPA